MSVRQCDNENERMKDHQSSVLLRNSTSKWWGKPKSSCTITYSCIWRKKKYDNNITGFDINFRALYHMHLKHIRQNNILTSWGIISGLIMSKRLSPCSSIKAINSASRSEMRKHLSCFYKSGTCIYLFTGDQTYMIGPWGCPSFPQPPVGKSLSSRSSLRTTIEGM